MARAKREGTWDRDPDDLPSPYPPAVRRRRFVAGFVVTFVGCLVLGALLHVLLGRPGPPWGTGAMIDGLIRSVFPALLVGWSCTRGPRKRR